jgi:hypothetical protein
LWLKVEVDRICQLDLPKREERSEMSSMKRLVAIAASVVMIVSCYAVSANAEVVRVEVQSRRDIMGGKNFGSAGAYEQLDGRIFFAVDPLNALNAAIADIQRAPRNAQGKVEFSSD